MYLALANVEVLNRVEDWHTPFLHYEVKVILSSKRSGLVEAEGIGSANSKEKNSLNKILTASLTPA